MPRPHDIGGGKLVRRTLGALFTYNSKLEGGRARYLRWPASHHGSRGHRQEETKEGSQAQHRLRVDGMDGMYMHALRRMLEMDVKVGREGKNGEMR